MSDVEVPATMSADREALAFVLAHGISGTPHSEVAREELAAIQAVLLRRRWQTYPDLWVREKLGEFVWSKQRQILRALASSRRVAVPSCHSAGKSFIAARAVAWWLDTNLPGEAFVVTSAPTGRQVKAILWREIGRAFGHGELLGRLNQTEWLMFVPESGREELVAFGQKPADMDPTAFQGIHARRVLVIFDEACGMPQLLWTAADTLLANDESRMLAIGNPDDPATEFHEVCKPGSGWETIPIDAFETPNFTGEEVPPHVARVLIGHTYVEEKRRKWGESNPLWESKIRGRFPEVSSDVIISPSWVRAAQDRELRPTEPNELGVDVGAGGDRNVVAHRRGPVVRIRRRDQEPDTMKSCGRLLIDLRETGAKLAKVDEIGVGAGLVDRAQEQGKPVVGVNVGKPAQDTEHFVNVRAEGYWALRERFLTGDIDLDPEDDDLAAQLCSLRYGPNSRGQMLIESKESMRRRGLLSPDDADAVMLAFLNLEGTADRGGVVLW